MIGEKVILKAPMSFSDAHYAGELVNGAKMLVWFGDVGTELMIRHDGHESMFAGYKDIEFLVPVYAGDYIEYHGWIEKVGNSSRTCKFEAYKVAKLLRDPKLNLFSAEALDPPVLIGRATGTLVVKKEWQRGATDKKFFHD